MGMPPNPVHALFFFALSFHYTYFYLLLYSVCVVASTVLPQSDHVAPAISPSTAPFIYSSCGRRG
jgi:hypothetical protein